MYFSKMFSYVTITVIVDNLKSRATKKKGRGFGGETHADVTEYEGLESTGGANNPNAPQRFQNSQFYSTKFSELFLLITVFL